MSLVEQYRQKIRKMDFIRMNDEELIKVSERDKKAVINAGLEGIYYSDEEESFFSMLLEERVPPSISKGIVKEWVIRNL